MTTIWEISPGMFTSAKGDYETPQDLFDQLDLEFHFTLDSCARDDNAKLNDYISPEQDALTKPWYGNVWMNPPYGKQIPTWMEKAYKESRSNASVVVCLVPSRTDTNWWHDWAMKGEIRFIRQRLKFGPNKVCAPFPSAIVIFRRD
jgi:phage N-6-adenine-methyltransferase